MTNTSEIETLVRWNKMRDKVRSTVEARQYTDRVGSEWRVSALNTPEYYGVHGKSVIYVDDAAERYEVHVYDFSGNERHTTSYKTIDAALRNGIKVADQPLPEAQPEAVEQATETEEPGEVISVEKRITWTDRTNYRNAPSHRQANVWDVTVNGNAYRVERAPGAYHVWDGLDWVGMYATTTDVEAAITPDEQDDSETTDGDALTAFEAKADEISKANGWTIARTENVMLRYLRDTSPAEAATIAAALQTRRELCA